jgi:hypothetical protein
MATYTGHIYKCLRILIKIGVKNRVNIPSYDRSVPPQGGAPIDKIGGNEESAQEIMSLLIRDCGGSSLWFQAIIFSRKYFRLCLSAANWEFLCGRRLQLIQEFMEGFGGEVDHRGLGPKRYLVSIIQLIGLVCEYFTAV